MFQGRVLISGSQRALSVCRERVLPRFNSGDFDIYEVFAEARIPLLPDLPAAQSLAFEGAIRFSDYSTIGSVTTWKTALDWQIVESVRATASLPQRGG